MGTVEQAPDEPPNDGFVRIWPPPGETGPTLNFAYKRAFTPPIWPSAAGAQNATQHLDIGADDLDAAETWAIEAGATRDEHRCGAVRCGAVRGI